MDAGFTRIKIPAEYIECEIEGQRKEAGTPRTAGEPDVKDDHGDAKNQATKLLEIVENTARDDRLKIFKTPAGEVFAAVNTPPVRETVPIDSPEFFAWLLKAYRTVYKNICGSDAVNSVINYLGGSDHDIANVCVRIGHSAGNIYVDMANQDREVVEITDKTWKLINENECPVRFWRPRGMLPLPTPDKSNPDLQKLRSVLNIQNDSQWQKVSMVLLSFFTNGPQITFLIIGQPGAAKSMQGEFIKRCLDPNETNKQAQSATVRDLYLSARNQAVLLIDNHDTINREFSNAYCLLATGGGYRERELRTNAYEFIYKYRRLLIITAVKDVITRPDLCSRKLKTELQKPAKRRTEKALIKEFEQELPSILGGLYDSVSRTLKENVEHPPSDEQDWPRMADAAEFLSGAENVFGWTPGTVLSIFNDESETDAFDSIATDSFSTALLKGVQSNNNCWKAKAAEVLEELTLKFGDKIPPWWPKTGKALGDYMRSKGGQLELVHRVKYHHSDSGERLWTFWIEPEQKQVQTTPSTLQDIDFGNGN
jgi:hypothetical protein